ncbi:hypothetical protein D3C81_1914710 [compost metagenome]
MKRYYFNLPWFKFNGLKYKVVPVWVFGLLPYLFTVQIKLHPVSLIKIHDDIYPITLLPIPMRQYI